MSWISKLAAGPAGALVGMTQPSSLAEITGNSPLCSWLPPLEKGPVVALWASVVAIVRRAVASASRVAGLKSIWWEEGVAVGCECCLGSEQAWLVLLKGFR
jgi:hypothetical protein